MSRYSSASVRSSSLAVLTRDGFLSCRECIRSGAPRRDTREHVRECVDIDGFVEERRIGMRCRGNGSTSPLAARCRPKCSALWRAGTRSLIRHLRRPTHARPCRMLGPVGEGTSMCSAAQCGVRPDAGVGESRDGDTLAVVIARADTALYAAKANGRSGVLITPSVAYRLLASVE